MEMTAAFAFTPTQIEPTMTGQQPAARARQREHDPPEHIVLRV